MEASPDEKTKKPRGGQKGNTNNFQHGAYSLLALRTKGKPAGNTKLGRLFRAIEREYLEDMGGESGLSRAQRQLANDAAWSDLLVATMDAKLADKRQLVRKGKPHPLIELREGCCSSAGNFRLMGVKKTVRTKSLDDILSEMGEETEPDVEHQPDGENAPTDR